MPLLADIVVKKADAATNVTYVAKQASSGDKSPAVWSQDTASIYRNQRPVLSVYTLYNGTKTARRLNADVKWPITRTVDGTPVVVHRCLANTTFLVPLDLTDVEANEFVHQTCNLFAAALFKAMASEGYAAT